MRKELFRSSSIKTIMGFFLACGSQCLVNSSRYYYIRNSLSIMRTQRKIGIRYRTVIWFSAAHINIFNWGISTLILEKIISQQVTDIPFGQPHVTSGLCSRWTYANDDLFWSNFQDPKLKIQQVIVGLGRGLNLSLVPDLVKSLMWFNRSYNIFARSRGLHF